MSLKYDPNETTLYGVYRCPVCSGRFYGGGRPAIHNPSCPHLNYDGCEFIFGPAQVKQVIERGEWHGLTLDDLRFEFPELLEGGEQ